MKTTKKIVAESATGCVENNSGLGKYFETATKELTPDEAMDCMLDGKVVSVPNAGAGSYKDFFLSVGFNEVKTIDTTSSAGDWSFGVFDGIKWILAFQTNRYPYHGFDYSYSWEMCADTFEELCDSAQCL
jgi:hypothetical protein